MRKVDSKHKQKALKFLFNSQKLQISCETQIFTSKFFQGISLIKYGPNLLQMKWKARFLSTLFSHLSNL